MGDGMATADAANELTSLHDKDGWTYFGYDANGNTVMEQAPGYTRYFDWDGRDMLIGVRSTEQGWTDNEIRYDGLASRAELVDSTGTTRYAWDGIRVLKLEDEEGDLKQRQVHGYAPIPSVGDIALMESAAGDPYAPIPDQVGTVCKVLGSAGALANSYQYDAFGVSRGASEAFPNPFRFAGKPLDTDPSLYHFMARQYYPLVGRFLRRDPKTSVKILNHYDYVEGDPISRSDPSGRWWIRPFKPGHRDVTLGGLCGFDFGAITLERFISGNEGVDERAMMRLGGPHDHFIAEDPTPLGRLRCFVESWRVVWKTMELAYRWAERCRKERWALHYGESGVWQFGGALHTVQDLSAHHCMTEQEHFAYRTDPSQSNPDDPAKHPTAWVAAQLSTCLFMLSYRVFLELSGWTAAEIRCCVEQPYELGRGG